MITVSLDTKSIVSSSALCKIMLVEQGFDFESQFSSLQKHMLPGTKEMMHRAHFTGASGSTFHVPLVDNTSHSQLICIGLGKKNDAGVISLEAYRNTIGKVIRMAEQHRWTTVALQLSESSLFSISDAYLARLTTEIIAMAAYHFDTYITDKERKKSIDQVTIHGLVSHNSEQIELGIANGLLVAQGVNAARHWIDLPPIALHPQEMVSIAQKIAEDNNLRITVFNEEQINAMGMGGLAAVGRGSERDCQLVILEYDCGNNSAPTLGFVGKGITFDSGGLSIKPAESMETMKDDMAGAAAVLAAMKVLAKHQAPVNIVGFMPLSENLPSGKAIKPGDIVTFYNGKTAEIKNTDAEGRLILADALSYAEKHYKLDAIVDLATLTGACAAALGPHYSGLMSVNEPLVEQLMKASADSGDTLWRLPLPEAYKAAIVSSVADLANIGGKGYKAGAITAGLFLSNFVEKTPWAHIDIAGSAFDVPGVPYYRPDSATGVGVRLLVSLAMKWNK